MFNMSRLILALPLLIAALVGIAIYVQVSIIKLSLPLSTATNVFTILLPLFAAANIFYSPVLSRLEIKPTIQPFLLPAVHISQGVLTVIIATLAAEGLISGQVRYCALETQWKSWWERPHNYGAIQHIQDSLNCCGFNTLRNMAYPESCAKDYQRIMHCDGLWSAASQRASGLQFAVAVVAGILQLAHLVYLRRRGGRDKVKQTLKFRPSHVEEHNGEASIEEAYHDNEEEEDDFDQDAPHLFIPAAQDDAAPRIQPSGLGREEANEWRV